MFKLEVSKIEQMHWHNYHSFKFLLKSLVKN